MTRLRWLLVGIVIMGAGAVLAFVGVRHYRQMVAISMMSVHIGTANYYVKVASKSSDLTKGLSGTTSLGTNSGMFFVFSSDAAWPFWMKDMKYPIDIIWIDSSKTVQYVVKDAQPSSYPQTTFRPAHASRYVLEVSAGQAQAHNIEAGSKVSFKLPSGVEQ